MVLRFNHRSLSLIVGGLFALTSAACANTGGAPPPVGGSGSSFSGNGGSGTASGASAGTQSLSGSTSGGILGPGSNDATTSGESCQSFNVQFTPRIPLVYVLVDSSGSMYQKSPVQGGGTADDWVPLGDAALSVMMSLDSQVDFGFGDYGSNGSASTYTIADYAAHACGLLNNVPIAPNNYAKINAVYGPLVAADMVPPGKVNTPAQIALGQAAANLTQAAAAQADAGAAPGGKYILLVTDGETDFCDDGSPLCPADAVTAEIQRLYTEGVQTLVLGLPSTQSTISPQALQAFANAGVGQPVTAPPSNPGMPPASPTTINQQCSGEGGWSALYKALPAGGGPSLATYAAGDAAVTNATLYSPTVADVASLTNQIAAALKTVKSCSFDLQGHIMVDLAHASAGTIAIDGAVLPYSADGGTDGWTMASSTELDLVGSACATWRATGRDISFDFPCEVLLGIPR